MLGFDALYRSDWSDPEIIDRALRDQRVVLTRDLGILKQKRVTHGYWLRSSQPEDQVAEVIEALDLQGQLRPFTRCLECNGTIRRLPPDQLPESLDPDIAARFEQFWQCGSCHRVYWQGSHYRHMLRAVQRTAMAAGRSDEPEAS